MGDAYAHANASAKCKLNTRVLQKLEHTCDTYIVKSNNGSKESQVIQLNQDVHVCGIWCV